jgi:hypothetical protein
MFFYPVLLQAPASGKGLRGLFIAEFKFASALILFDL